MARQRSRNRVRLDRLPVAEGALLSFFLWRPGIYMYLMEPVRELPGDTVLTWRKSEHNEPPRVKFYDLVPTKEYVPSGMDDTLVGYVIRTPSKTPVVATSAYMHVGDPESGNYEPWFGITGIQVYAGDSDTILISAREGGNYINRVRADVIT